MFCKRHRKYDEKVPDYSRYNINYVPKKEPHPGTSLFDYRQQIVERRIRDNYQKSPDKSR